MIDFVYFIIDESLIVLKKVNYNFAANENFLIFTSNEIRALN